MGAPQSVDITIDSMITVLFTGDSQTCGRNLGIDYPQLLSRRLKARVINTAVGGSNSSALLRPMTGGSLRVSKGDRMVYGTKVRWGMGPFPGMKITIHGKTYTIDYIHEHPRTPHTEIALIEPAEEDYQGDDYAIEPGWHERVAQYSPDVVCLMYINDGAMPPAKQEDWRDMIRRIRAMDAVPVLMSPFPIDGEDTGGNHPGENRKYAKNAAAVRELAESEGCWFVDVFNLTFALDPALRCIIGDGVHPDTDGQTVAIDGLMWVFEQMGVMAARPYIKGWVTDTPPPWPVAPGPEMRPFRTSQPDHPTPDRQLTEGFTLEAFRKNDEYRLIAEKDGMGVEFKQGIRLEVGFANGLDRNTIELRIDGRGIGAVYAGNRNDQSWIRLDTKEKDGHLTCTVPAQCISDDHVIQVGLAAEDGAVLDRVAARAQYTVQPEPWKPSAATPTAYPLQSDHDRTSNCIRNPAFLGAELGWTTEGAVHVNRPFSASIGQVAFGNPADLREAKLETIGKARPFDLISVTGSALKNDGNYRIKAILADNTVLVRRKAEAVEENLKGVLHHSDGCGLVPGETCLELSGKATVGQVLRLPEDAPLLGLSFFYRALDPHKLRTRDTPDVPATVTLTLTDAAGNKEVRRSAWPCSFQWRKAQLTIPFDTTPATARITFSSPDKGTLQVTGVYAGPEAVE